MKPPKHRPPQLVENFLAWILKTDLSEEVLGDLEEKYYTALEQHSPQRAKWNYCYQAIHYLRPFALKNNIFSQLNPFFMFRHHVKISFRHFKRNTSTFLINTIGLALGVTCCLLIGLYIQDEYNYDQQHENLAQLYRVYLDINMNEWEGKNNAVPPILAPTLVAEIPEIEKAARLNPYFNNAGTNLVRKTTEVNNRFEEKFVYADQSFFEMFDLPLIYGNQSDLLTQPNTLAISERIANKYFPNQNPVGESLILNDAPDAIYKITGVIENIPSQSHFDYDFFLSMPSLMDSKTSTTWLFNNYYAYVQLRSGVQPEQLKEKLKQFTIKNFGPQFKEQQNVDLAALEQNGQRYWVDLQPVSAIHLHSAGFSPQLKPTGDVSNVRMFLAIALFILLIAVVNFINLSTARSANRAQEVGVRKVLGSLRTDLVSQFLCESLIITLLAFTLGSTLAWVVLNPFNELAGKTLAMPFTNPLFFLSLLGSALIIGLLAGLYPSFYLSAFEPIKVLKGKLSKGAKGSWLRSGLVVLQFAISIGLIVGTLVVYQQMDYIQNKSLGFDKEQVLLIQDTYILDEQLSSFRNALKNLPETKNATLSSYTPLEGGRRNSVTFHPEGKSALEDQILLQRWSVDNDYINTFAMKITEGRNFNLEKPTDSLGVILNQTAVRKLGYADNPIGKRIGSPYADINYTILGVIEDFNYESLKGEVKPLGLFLSTSNSVISVKANTSDISQLLAKTENLWKTFVPNQPFRYDFLDDRFAQMYTVERRISQLFLIFTGLAIFIACLGLLALASFMTEQRFKEIGIRKVLGASVFGIVKMLSADFTKMVLLAIAIALPLSYFGANQWLDNFAYRIDLSPTLFIVAGLMALGIAWLTVSFRTVKAALVNPTESLKGE